MLYNPWGGAGLRPPLSAIRHRRYKERNFRHDSGGSAVSILLAMTKSPNQPMKPTQHFVVSFRSMRTLIFKVLGGLSLSR